MKNLKYIFFLAPVLGIQICRAQPGPQNEPDTNLEHLTLTIQCTNTVFKMGDEIPVEFVISNGGSTDFHYLDRDYDRNGRMQEYALTVKSADGKIIPDARAKYGAYVFGGLGGLTALGPGESFTKTIPLNLWAIPPVPGQYTVTGTYWGSVYSVQSPSGIHSAPITITVLPRTGA